MELIVADNGIGLPENIDIQLLNIIKWKFIKVPIVSFTKRFLWLFGAMCSSYSIKS